jgi:hypothetical protein
MAESFFATLKSEFYYRRFWPTENRAKLELGAWIEDRYNRRLRHSSIGQLTPGGLRDATLQPPRGRTSSRITPCPPNGVKAIPRQEPHASCSDDRLRRTRRAERG